MSTESGREAIVERYRLEPHAGARALFLEAVARSLNERQTLISGSSAADLVASAELATVHSHFLAMVDACEHAIYEVRRLTRRSAARMHGRGITARSLRAVARGSRDEMNDALHRLPGERRTDGDGIVRHVLRARTDQPPALEHFFVVCPAVVEDKERPSFEAWWQEATTDAVLF